MDSKVRFGNPKKFSEIARRVGRKKPIAVVKSGRSAAGARATSSHTGALIAVSDVTVDALFRQAGVVRTEDLRADEAAAIVAAALVRGEGWLTPDDVAAPCSCYGLPLIEQRIVANAEEAGEAAELFGGEVAVKAIAADLVHKTEVGAVRLHLHGAHAVRGAAREMNEVLSS